MRSFKTLSPPQSLVKTQQWLATAIRTLDDTQRQIADTEASKYLTQSDFLNSKERLNIYISDYWPRCLDSLEDDFPYLKRWLGDQKFRTMMTSYMDIYPSRSFTLTHLPQDLISYLNTHYTNPDKDMVTELASIEWAQLLASFSPKKKAFSPKKCHSNSSVLHQKKLHLQPHITLLSLSHDWLTWMAKKSTKKPAATHLYIAIFQHDDSYETYTLNKGTYLILNHLKTGYPLHLAIETTLKKLNQSESDELEKTVKTLFEDATRLQWFYESQ